MVVNSTEVQNNFGKYLELASEQEVVITKNGTAVARLIGIKAPRKSLSEQLRGIIPVDVDEKAIKEERLLNR
ncbi:MAG: type II toxin-antitoxin system prevent-host-death family antitoxin [Clostridiales Family XIII bacterium]|jgi:prevent-host-death family protein|nr:type II toxin-antitoxin system prevent-host-death family antitoxin [Clostridiales Family XIII bacterium]